MIMIECYEIHPRTKPPDIVDVLNVLPDNDLDWRLLELEGPGGPFQGKYIDEIADSALNLSSGLGLPWCDVWELSATMVQAVDMLLVAVEPRDSSRLDSKIASGRYDECQFMAEVFDSGFLRIGVNQCRDDRSKVVANFINLGV
ncbi:hypothetical protein ACOQFL_09320 [Actinopolyspora sp. H202]|uniref:hypothetical protein n=1 Tax=Actinopolyspora sp. H202 TaxID=1500456 RepID=UPI003EE7C952